MASQRRLRAERISDTVARRSPHDVASYVAQMVAGVRSLTQAAHGSEIRLLDYMLAVAESQARRIAKRGR